MANRTESATSDKRAIPKKPHPDFPLFPHRNGQWAKKVKQKLIYFGKWEDPDAALNLWLKQKDDLLAGRKPRSTDDYVSVKDVCNAFMTDRMHRRDAGDIVERSYQDYHDTCERLLRHLDKNRRADDLRPEDFNELRAAFAKKWNPNTVANEVQRVRVIFNYAYQAGLVDAPIRFGPSFKRPSKKVLRKVRNEKGPRLLEPGELLQLIDSAKQPLKAMILLGLNCGFGNSDCANLPMSAINLDGGWIDFPRPKTGINRRCPLWPETVSSLQEVLDKRKEPKDAEFSRLAFITRHGNPFANPKDPAVITKEFRKLLDSLDLYRPGIGFYALRHIFETMGGESRDQVAVDHIMGHVDNSMAATYRERISDERLKAVTGHVHGWLYGVEGGEK